MGRGTAPPGQLHEVLAARQGCGAEACPALFAFCPGPSCLTVLSCSPLCSANLCPALTLSTGARAVCHKMLPEPPSPHLVPSPTARCRQPACAHSAGQGTAPVRPWEKAVQREGCILCRFNQKLLRTNWLKCLGKLTEHSNPGEPLCPVGAQRQCGTKGL